MEINRTAALCGLVTAALIVVAGVLGNAGGTPPIPGAPAEAIAAFYRTNESSTVFSALANAIAAAPLLLLAGSLSTSLGSKDGDEPWAQLGHQGAVVFAVMLLVVSVSQLALPAASGEPSAAAALSEFWSAGVAILGLAIVPLLAGFGVSTIRSPTWPSWIGWTALVGAAAGFVGALSAGLAGPIGGVASLIGQIQYPALFVWLVASSLALRRRPGNSVS